MKKTGLGGVIKFFSVNFNPVNNNDIWGIDKYLMKRAWYKKMLPLIKKIFVGLINRLVNESNHTKYVSLNNLKCMI